MRARQPAGSALTGQEIASSNTTLNALLGGRQKSWMTGVGSAIRPTPRVQVSQRPELNVLPLPAPSDEPSPQQFVAQDGSLSDTSHVVNYIPPHILHQHQSPPISSSEESTRTPLVHIPTTPQAYTNMQANIPSAQQAHQPKRQKTIQTLSSTPSLTTRKPLIEQHILESGGWDSLEISVERPRFLLLIDACQREDLFFVALHQLFCLWAVDPTAILQTNGFQNQKTMGHAFQLVTKLIRGNEGLSPVHLKWFTEFPSPLNHLLARSDQYRRAVSAVSFFLLKLTTEKSDMIQECQQRGFPPLVDEMIHRLGLTSPVLQGVFFTASRRTLGVRDEIIGPQMERLFLHDRESHERLAARINTNFPPSENEVRERNVFLAHQYLLVRKNQKQPEVRQSTRSSSITPSQAAQIPASESFANSPQTPSFPQHSYQDNISVQSPISIMNIPNQPSERPDPQLDSLHYSASIGQTSYQNTQQGIFTPTANSYAPQQPLREPGLQTLNPQLQDGYSSGHSAQPILQSNHNQTPLNPTVSNTYPGAIMSTHMQANHFRQQPLVVSPQQFVPTMATQNCPPQQLQSQQTTQHYASTTVPEQNVQGLRRINSVPTLSPVSQSPVHGGHIMNPPLARQIRTDGHAAQQNSAKSPWHIPLIPQQGESLPNHAPNPDITALHQSVLRSPILVPVDRRLDFAREDPLGRYYQAVVDFAMGPVPPVCNRTLRIESFIIPHETYARIPRDKLSADAPPVRYVQRGSLQYRMRCIQVKRGQPQNAYDFVVADTVWPASIYIELNGVHLQIRRKLHYGRDLPIDITASVRSVANNNVNQVKISVPQPNGLKDDLDYYFAVEIVEILQHQQIIDMTSKRHIPIEETINSIKKSLSGSFIDDDDDEISMVVGDLTINLADPFLARIFDTPVRGSSCLHRECFDLQTFLTTRNSKPRTPQQPSMVDVWRCPLCGKDARPYSLQIDDFLVSVRESLERSNELHTKAIVISADGTWKAVPEALPAKRSASRAGLDKEEDDDDSEDEGMKNLEIAARKRSADIEVIELDDD